MMHDHFIGCQIKRIGWTCDVYANSKNSTILWLTVSITITKEFSLCFTNIYSEGLLLFCQVGNHSRIFTWKMVIAQMKAVEISCFAPLFAVEMLAHWTHDVVTTLNQRRRR